MLIIEVKKNQINMALKQYKRKVRDTRLLKKLRKNRHYTKPSVKRRNEIIQAIYSHKKTIED